MNSQVVAQDFGGERRGMVNVYVCKARHRLVTRNRDEGTTSFMVGCKTDGCREGALSSFYRVPQELGSVATHEWIAPNEVELTACLDECRASFQNEVDAGRFAQLYAKYEITPDEQWKLIEQQTRDHCKSGGLILRRIETDVAKKNSPWSKP